MKRYKFLHGFIACCIILIVVSCSKMDDTYRQFVVPDGLTYVGKANPVFINSGRKRVKISWLRGTDQKLTMARIYWNNRADSLDVPVTATNPLDTISVFINNLSEGSYSFFIYTYDANKNSSIRVDVLGVVYDTTYERSLLNRVVTSVRKAGDTAIVSILTLDTTSLGTRFSYINRAGNPVDLLVRRDSLNARLPGINTDTSFTYVTLYKPDKSSLDTFYTSSGIYPQR